ncbi:hypothetical protein K439DRAFT_1559057 [Ramaria rubella]|nr:hypothetical protein K439DRAFT_1559057 [Ramaria rubella]
MADHKNIWQNISIPPVCVKLSVQQDGASNEDNLTIKLRLQFQSESLVMGDLGSTVCVRVAVIGPRTLPVASKGLFFSIAIFLVLHGRKFTSHNMAHMHLLWYVHPSTGDFILVNLVSNQCIFPIAITHLIGLKEENVPEPVWIFSMFFLFSLGAVDSIIYTTTCKLIKPLNFQTHMQSSDNSSMKAHGSYSRNNTVAEWSEFHGTSLKP